MSGKKLSEYLLINFLCVATPEEKEDSINHLTQLTGLSYKTVKEWNDYLREKEVKPKI